MKQLGMVALVFVGLNAMLQALVALSSNVWMLGSFSDIQLEVVIGVVSLAAVILLFAGFGWFLIARRESLADMLFGDGNLDLAVDGIGLLRVALIVFGLILVMGSFPQLLGSAGGWLSQAAMERTYEMDLAQDPSRSLDLAVGALLGVIKLAAGIWFLTKSNSIAVRLWSGAPKPSPVIRSMSACSACGAEYDPAEYEDLARARCIECKAPLFPGSA